MIVNPFYSHEVHGDYELISIGRLDLEDGGSIPDCQLAVATWGELTAARSSCSRAARAVCASVTFLRNPQPPAWIAGPSPTVNGLGRSGQLASLPLARRLSVVPAERRGEGVRRGVTGPAGDLGEGQLAGPQVVSGEGHPPVC